MSKHNMKKLLSIVLCIVLTAAVALFATGCAGNTSPTEAPEVTKIAEVSFTVVTQDLEGMESTFEITTDKKTVGEALLAEGLIDGEDGEYGLYIKSVNGVTLDWDTHGKYWAFYIDGEYALTGVDSTDVAEGATYSFVPES